MCRENGFDKVRRTAQYCGKTGDAADCIGLPNIHQEVKCVEKLNVYDAYNQANRKRKYKPFLVVMSADDFFRIYKESEWSNENGS